MKGKIVILLTGAPTSFQTEERAHYGNGTVKRLEAAKRGAVGVITMCDHQQRKAPPVRARRERLSRMADDLARGQ